MYLFTDTVTVLINAVGDNENSVNNVVIKSLTKIANAYPNDVIEIFCEFYKNTPKANPLQLANIVKYVYFIFFIKKTIKHKLLLRGTLPT